MLFQNKKSRQAASRRIIVSASVHGTWILESRRTTRSVNWSIRLKQTESNWLDALGTGRSQTSTGRWSIAHGSGSTENLQTKKRMFRDHCECRSRMLKLALKIRCTQTANDALSLLLLKHHNKSKQQKTHITRMVRTDERFSASSNAFESFGAFWTR